jgi:hypothetical protein
MKWFAVLFGLFVIMNLYAQENASLNFDIDLLFDLPDQEVEEQTEEETTEVSIISLVKKRGIILDASFEFIAGLIPGLTEALWFEDEEGENIFYNQKILKMASSFVIDAQISETFRVLTNINFSIPPYSGFGVGDFFFDYNLLNKVFFRGGKYEHTWGISPNFSFTNLLSRVPSSTISEYEYSNEAFMFKVDVPIKIGGFQFIIVTREALMLDHIPSIRNLGYGLKYNVALPTIDSDLGFFYQKDMAFRSFLSLKKTIGKTEIYNEWLAVIDDIRNPRKLGGAFSIGFYRDFLKNTLTLNGELFYNAEDDAYWYSPETNVLKEDVLPYLKGLNAAFNLIYRFDGTGAPRFFTQVLYSMNEKSALLTPGFRLSPFQHLEFYFAVPMALGRRDGYYYQRYQRTGDFRNRPFSIVLMLSLKGGFRTGYYY